MPSQPPQKLGRYEILEELGRGAMGVVFRARDPLIGREVAIKTFRIGYSVKDEEMEQFRRRFIREAQSAGILSHPNIVTIHDVVEATDEGMSFIAMEYVAGATLKQYLQGDRPPDHEFAVEMVSQIASALDYAHAKGVVHRDIKPANILITQDHRAKITDFGIARLNTSNLTQDGQLLGTPNYMAPEQIMGKDIDHRADIFALGVLLYELLTRQKPFSGENLTTVTHRVVYEAFTPPEQFVPGLPSGFTPVLNKALEKDPTKRYQKAGDLAADLKAALTRARLDESAETVSVSKFTPPAPPPAAPPAPAKDAAAPAKTAEPETSKDKDKAKKEGAPAAAAKPAAAPPHATAPAAKPAGGGAPPPAGPPAAPKGAAGAVAPSPAIKAATPAAKPAPTGAVKPAGGAKKAPVGLLAGLAGLVLVVALGAYFATRGGSGEPSPEASEPATVASPNQSPEYLAAIADGQQKLLSGDPAAAGAAFARAESLAPGDETARSLRLEAERQAAQKGAAAQGGARPASPRPAAGGSGASTAAVPAPLPGTGPGAAGAAGGKKPAEPAPTTAEMAVDFATELPQGVLTVYVGRDQVMREAFRFSRRGNEPRVIQQSRTVAAGDSSLRVIVALEGKPTKVVELQGNFRGGSSRTLTVRVDAAGNATASLK